jgi:hypothetical protein
VRGDSRLKDFGFFSAIQKPVTPELLQDTLIAALEEAGAKKVV